MSAGRHPRLGIQWAAPPSGGGPAPTLYLPLRSDLLDDSANGFTNTSSTVPTIDVAATSPIGTGAAAFAGALNQYLEFSDNPLLDPGTDDFFISFWAYMAPSSPSSYPAAVGKGSYQSSAGAWNMYVNNANSSGINWGYGNPWVEGVLQSGATGFPPIAWNHVYIERLGNTMSLRTNNVARATLNVTGVDFTNAHVLRIGNDLSGGNSWDGYIQDFVYGKGSVLTAQQITDLQTTVYGDLP